MAPRWSPAIPAASRLFKALSYADVNLQMPPSGKLPDAAVEDLRQWIASGAAWPEEPVPRDTRGQARLRPRRAPRRALGLAAGARFAATTNTRHRVAALGRGSLRSRYA